MSGVHLVVDEIDVRYGAARALSGVSLDIGPGSAVAILGANGAGKSSLARAITGVVTPSGGQVAIDGQRVTRWAPHRIARLGVAHVPEGRGIFPGLTVLDNLRMGLRYCVARSDRDDAIGRALARFPILAERLTQRAATLSGGQQQMLALARVLAAPPRLIVADELSLGLAPILIDEVFDALREARSQGATLVLVEQFVGRALELCDTAVILRRGRIVWRGSTADAESAAAETYLGGSPSAGS
jgi:branched-chain amino acid transport system ATP-binding protein